MTLREQVAALRELDLGEVVRSFRTARKDGFALHVLPSEVRRVLRALEALPSTLAALEAAWEALEFYGDEDSYKIVEVEFDGKRHKGIAVAADGGARARTALAARDEEVQHG